jgi:hypothetical protein
MISPVPRCVNSKNATRGAGILSRRNSVTRPGWYSSPWTQASAACSLGDGSIEFVYQEGVMRKDWRGQSESCSELVLYPHQRGEGSGGFCKKIAAGGHQQLLRATRGAYLCALLRHVPSSRTGVGVHCACQRPRYPPIGQLIEDRRVCVSRDCDPLRSVRTFDIFGVK